MFPVSSNIPTPPPSPASMSGNHFDLSSATSRHPISLPEAAQQTILLYTKTQKLSISANHPQGFMNRTSWSPQSAPLLSLPRSAWDENQLIPYIPSDAWVDIVINNLDDGSHPFHLHGYSFYVLASHRSENGWGSYNPYSTSGASSIAPVMNLRNPVKKDTVSVPRRGYVVIRLKADNEGIWMLHCHVLFHQGSGMAMGIHVGGDERHAGVDLGAREFCESA
jgi:FtsP/CotA-like multicopper oxidase with cupredoxin domain